MAAGHSLDGRQWTFRASQPVSLRTIRRAELADRHNSMTAANDWSIRRALEAAGVEFIEENGGGPGVRLKKRTRPKSTK
jgi:hypothetical protein